MAIEPRNALFLSLSPIDQILATYRGSFNIAAPTSGGGFSTTATANIPTGISSPTLFVGVYSIDGGTTWNDFTNQQLVLPPGILFPYFEVHGKSTANNLAITANNYDAIGGPNTAFTVMYRVALVYRPGMGAIDQSLIGNTNTNQYFNSQFNYQKIAVDDASALSIASLGSQTITLTHNLGYIPKIRQFIYRASDQSLVQLGTESTGSYSTSITTTTVTTVLNGPVGGLTGILYTRIYFDD